MSQMTGELAVRKSVFVRCTPEHAFHVYTERMSDWYPIEGHSIFDDPQSTVVWEGHVGGHVYERSSSGEQGLWGTIIVWDPPRELAMTCIPAGVKRPRRSCASASLPRATARRSSSSTRAGSGSAPTSASGWPATTEAGVPCSTSSRKRRERRTEMHPDIAMQLAAERQGDLQRQARTLARPRLPARRWRLRPRPAPRYAGAPTGARTGT